MSACALCLVDDDATNTGSAIVLHHIATVDDRAVRVCRWPLRTTVEDAVLPQMDPKFCEVDGDTVTFRVANGWATYRVEKREPYLGRTVLALVDHELVRKGEP